MGKLYFPASEVAKLLGIEEDFVINFCKNNDCNKVCKYNSKGQITEYILSGDLVKKLTDKKKAFFSLPISE